MKKIIKIFGIVYIFIFSSVFLVFNYDNEKYPSPEIINKIDNFYITQKDTKPTLEIPEKINFVIGDGEEKNFKLIPYTQNVIISPLGKTDSVDNQYLVSTKNINNLYFDLKHSGETYTYVDLIYDRNFHELKLKNQEPKVGIGDNSIENQSEEKIIASNINDDSILKIGNQVYFLTQTNKITIPTSNLDNILLYEKSNRNNLIEGISDNWQNQAFDCSDTMLGDPVFSLATTTDASEGSSAIKIASSNHYACISHTFPINIDSGKLYKLQFDYKNVSGKKIMFYYSLQNNLKEDLGYQYSDMENVQLQEWDTENYVIDPDNLNKSFAKSSTNNFMKRDFTGNDNQENSFYDSKDSTNIESIKNLNIFFYAPSDGVQMVENIYKNLRFDEYTFTKKLDVDKNILLKEMRSNSLVNLSATTSLTFEYNDSQENNLLDQAATFENDNWQNQAFDCSDTMLGDPVFSLATTTDASEGGSAIKIASSNHYACISHTFPINIDSGKLYKLQFDYKNVSGKKIMFYYSLQNSSENQSESKQFQAKNQDWNNYSLLINPEIENIKKINITLYAPSDGGQVVENIFDNIKLTELKPKNLGDYFLIANNPNGNYLNKNPSLFWNRTGFLRYKLFIYNIDKSFLLSLSNKYSKYWELSVVKYSVNNESLKKDIDRVNLLDRNIKGGFYIKKLTVGENDHFKLNDYGNMWLVTNDICSVADTCNKNSDGSYNVEMIIEFSLERWVYFGLILLGIPQLFYFSYSLIKINKKTKSIKLEPVNPYAKYA